MESRGPGSVRKAHTEDILRESIDDLEESIQNAVEYCGCVEKYFYAIKK